MILSSSNHDNCISWLENLKNGIWALLIHPFFPLLETKFDYKCLFSYQPYCCIENKTHDRHIFSHDSIINSIKQSLNLEKFKIEVINLYSKIINDVIYINPGRLLIVAQLILCTLLLSYFIFKDIKNLSRRFRV